MIKKRPTVYLEYYSFLLQILLLFTSKQTTKITLRHRPCWSLRGEVITPHCFSLKDSWIFKESNLLGQDIEHHAWGRDLNKKTLRPQALCWFNKSIKQALPRVKGDAFIWSIDRPWSLNSSRQHNFGRKGLGPGGTQALYEAGSE